MREEKADNVDQTDPDNPDTVDPATNNGTAEDKPYAHPKPKRSRTMGLAAPGPDRSRSHSRRSTVTDKGQTGPLADNPLGNTALIPTSTATSSDRKASPLPSPTGELKAATSPAPGIIVSDNPQSPATLIPATDTLSTRPTKGGIAYPFSLKVDGPEGKDVNASTATLQSVNITTPPAVDIPHHEKELVASEVTSQSVNEQILNERPGVERYFTAGPGAVLSSSDVQENAGTGVEKIERPPVERFETAQEDLSTLARGEKA